MSGNNIVNTVTITAEQLNKELVNLATVMGTDVAKLISYYKVLKTDTDSLIAVTNTIAATLKELNHKNIVAEGIDAELKLLKESSEAANTKITENKTAIDKVAEDLNTAKTEISNKITEIEGKLNPAPGNQPNLNLQEIKDSIAALEVAKSNLENNITRLESSIRSLSDDASDNYSDLRTKMTSLDAEVKKISTQSVGMLSQSLDQLGRNVDNLIVNTIPMSTEKATQNAKKYTDEEVQKLLTRFAEIEQKASALEHRILELETKP